MNTGDSQSPHVRRIRGKNAVYQHYLDPHPAPFSEKEKPLYATRSRSFKPVPYYAPTANQLDIGRFQTAQTGRLRTLPRPERVALISLTQPQTRRLRPVRTLRSRRALASLPTRAILPTCHSKRSGLAPKPSKYFPNRGKTPSIYSQTVRTGIGRLRTTAKNPRTPVTPRVPPLQPPPTANLH